MAEGCLREWMLLGQLPRLEQRMLWCHVLDVAPSWLIAHDTDPLPARALTAYRELEAKRLAGEPMAYLLGNREFMGHEFVTTADVLIPRPETEVLVEVAVQAIDTLVDRRQGSTGPIEDAPLRVLDLGTGSGAIAIAIALARPAVNVTATDVSQAALDIAGKNAQRLGARIELLSGNWYHALPEGVEFDVIVSNPPYIAAADHHLHEGDLRFEPMTALSDGADGLQALQCIVAGAHAVLRPDGALLVEHGWDQAADVAAMFRQAGWANTTSWPDLAGIARVTGGFLSSS